MTKTQTFEVKNYQRTTTAIALPTVCPRCGHTKTFERFPSPYYKEKTFKSLCDDCKSVILHGVEQWPAVSQEYRKLFNKVRSLKRRRVHTSESLRALRVQESLLASVNRRRLEIKELKRDKRKYIDFK